MCKVIEVPLPMLLNTSTDAPMSLALLIIFCKPMPPVPLVNFSVLNPLPLSFMQNNVLSAELVNRFYNDQFFPAIVAIDGSTQQCRYRVCGYSVNYDSGHVNL